MACRPLALWKRSDEPSRDIHHTNLDRSGLAKIEADLDRTMAGIRADATQGRDFRSAVVARIRDLPRDSDLVASGLAVVVDDDDAVPIRGGRRVRGMRARRLENAGAARRPV